MPRALPRRRAEDPDELYEAARVDGAGFVREFFSVTLPGLREEVVVAATLTTITALRNFDIIYNTTAGGPGGETEVPSWVMFQNAFVSHHVGYAAAIATVLTVIISAVARPDRPPLGRARRDARARPLHDLRRAGRVLARSRSTRCISIVFLAFHKKTDLVTGFAFPTTFSLDTSSPPGTRATSRQGMWGSFLVAATVTVVSAVLSLLTGYAFGTMRFPGSGRCSST